MRAAELCQLSTRHSPWIAPYTSGDSVPRDEIATAIARCGGWLADSVVTGESIESGEGGAIHYGGSSQIVFNR